MLVVDASIAVKWFKPDEKSSQVDFFLTADKKIFRDANGLAEVILV